MLSQLQVTVSNADDTYPGTLYCIIRRDEDYCVSACGINQNLLQITIFCMSYSENESKFSKTTEQN